MEERKETMNQITETALPDASKAKAADEKARKIARDEEMRRQKAAHKAKREGN